jgi:hypothetical protein
MALLGLGPMWSVLLLFLVIFAGPLIVFLLIGAAS